MPRFARFVAVTCLLALAACSDKQEAPPLPPRTPRRSRPARSASSPLPCNTWKSRKWGPRARRTSSGRRPGWLSARAGGRSGGAGIRPHSPGPGPGGRRGQGGDAAGDAVQPGRLARARRLRQCPGRAAGGPGRSQAPAADDGEGHRHRGRAGRGRGQTAGGPAQRRRGVAGRQLPGGGGSDTLLLRSPRAGVVINRNTTPGASVGPDSGSLFTVGDPTALWINADVFESDLSTIAQGSPVQVVVPSLDRPLAGKVLRVGRP